MNDEILSEAEEIGTNLGVEDEVDSTENVETNDLTEILNWVKALPSSITAYLKWKRK